MNNATKKTVLHWLTAACLLAAGSVRAAEPDPQVQTGLPLTKATVVSSELAVKDVCAWPNLTLLPDGTIVAMIYNQPSHLEREGGDLECWASTDGGKTWGKRGTPAVHDPKTSRANTAAGLAHNGDLIVLVSGWSYGPRRRLGD